MPAGKITTLVIGLIFLSQLGRGAELRELRGHVPKIVPQLTSVGNFSPTNRISLAISLPMRDQIGLDQFLHELYDPHSTNFHRFLSSQEFTARFGPTESDYETVKNFARTNGFTITGTHRNRAILDVTANSTNVENAFHVHLKVYRHPREPRNFFAPDNEPTIQSNLPISHISGLDNFFIPRPAGLKSFPVSQKSAALPASGSGPSGLYAGKDFHAAYAPGVSLNGGGQTVALFELDGYFPNDIISYENQSGVPSPVLTNILVDGYNGSAGGNNLEVALDIEVALAMATNLSQVIIYEAQNNGVTTVDALNQIASDNSAKQISSSWLIGDNAAFDVAYQQMVAQGQTFFQASGDDGAYYSGISQWADDTNITLVGGTTLTTTGPGGAYSSEKVWNWYSSGQGSAGSGGGINFNNVPIPDWQTGIDMTTNQGSTSLRNVPDVALTADNIFVVANNGTNYYVGGTSAAAPLWAGFIALVNQQAALQNLPSVGFLNPAIYAIGTGSNYAANFHDITVGNNTNTTVGATWPAAPGYDLCTGWGSPNGQTFINMLVPPDSLIIAPPNGFNAVGVMGGPFNPNSQTFLLTNSSASTFDWSLINTSAWLTASINNGTLAANSATNLTINVNAAASSLGLGSYAASIQFSNSITHVVQTLPFHLQILDSLSISPAMGFASSGASGGPFNTNAETFLLNNVSSNSFNWQCGNTSVWLNVSPSAGTLGGGAQTNVVVSLNSAAANLLPGIYSATIFFTNQTSGFVQNRQFNLFISQSIVLNGGFETGDNSDWPFTGTSGDSGVGDSSSISGILPHSGNYYWAFGEPGAEATISQTLPTSSSQLYQLSLWLNSSRNPYTDQFGRPLPSTPNEFTVAWNGTNIFDKFNVGKVGWTNLQFLVTATGASTVLQFSGRDDNYFLGLDDVSVIPVNAPNISVQPTNLTLPAGSNAIFSATAGGSPNLIYQWRKNGTNLSNGAGISGATSNILTLTAVTTSSTGNYLLLVTNNYGAVTSSIASLLVILPPTVSNSSITNRILECGSNNPVFTVTANGTLPLNYQWTLDTVPITGATNTIFSLTNLHSPNHIIGLVITNLYGNSASNATLTVQDTISPALTLNGNNPFFLELGNAFIDPGATATDLCAGAISVIVSGSVNTNSISTNTLNYFANDGNGNTNSLTRTVFVRDTTPPTILWSFTNLVLAANSNCIAPMPDVTGTNFILATDFSPFAISQIPTNNFSLPPGTNSIVITLTDTSSNISFSTNTIIVQDQTPPQILLQPQNQTNLSGTTANFSIAATACSPLAYQWFFNNSILSAQTNFSLTLSNLISANAGNYFAVATASGGSSTSAVATLTIFVPPNINSVTANSNGSFTLNFLGTTGAVYVLQSATNLAPPILWLPLFTNSPDTNGFWQFTDTQATNFQQQFYRLQLQQ